MPGDLFLFVYDFRIDDWTFVFTAAAAPFLLATGLRATFPLWSVGAGFLAGCFVEFSRDCLPRFIQLLTGGANGRGVPAFDRFFYFIDRRFNFALVVA